jgi:hypothetical protein
MIYHTPRFERTQSPLRIAENRFGQRTQARRYFCHGNCFWLAWESLKQLKFCATEVALTEVRVYQFRSLRLKDQLREREQLVCARTSSGLRKNLHRK